MVTQEQIDRINELSRKSKAEGLTEEEKAEQAVLRRAYVDAVKESLVGQIQNIRIVEKDGSQTKIEKKRQHVKGKLQ